MAKFLSDEWLDAVRAHADGKAGDLSVRLHVAVGDAQFHAIVVDGSLETLASGPLGDADVSLTVPPEDAIAIATRRDRSECAVHAGPHEDGG